MWWWFGWGQVKEVWVCVGVVRDGGRRGTVAKAGLELELELGGRPHYQQ